MADHKITELKDLSKDDFINGNDSVFIKLQYVPEAQGYKVYMFNTLVAPEEEDLDEAELKARIFVLGRGLAEIALRDPEFAFNIGYDVMPEDTLEMDDNLSEDEKELLRNPVGQA